MAFRETKKDGTTVVSGQVLTMETIIDLLHPVNSIYFTTENVNPATRLGGTWVAWGSGMVPVGVNAADPSFDVPEKVGGEKNHILTTAEMPSHAHSFPKAIMSWPDNASAAEHTVSNWGTVAWPQVSMVVQTNNNGGDQAHNNLQPYITCYMWKRTA